MAVLKAENIKLVYGAGTSFEKTALSDVSFEIEKGEFIGIIGHYGCFCKCTGMSGVC